MTEISTKDKDDLELASKIRPKEKFVVPVIKYKDLKGNEVDDKLGVKLALLTAGQYQAKRPMA